MNAALALLVLLLQDAPAPVATSVPAPPPRELVLTAACKVTAAGSLNDPRPGQQDVVLLDSEWEVTSKRHLTVDEKTLTVRYEQAGCRSVPQGDGCPAASTLVDRSFAVALPSAGGVVDLQSIVWPAEWTQRERDSALADLPLMLAAAAADPQAPGAAMSEGLLGAVPGAALVSAAGDGAGVRGEFSGTGVPVPLVGTAVVSAHGVTLDVQGTSIRDTNSMGQTRQDRVRIVCTRELTPAV